MADSPDDSRPRQERRPRHCEPRMLFTDKTLVRTRLIPSLAIAIGAAIAAPVFSEGAAPGRRCRPERAGTDCAAQGRGVLQNEGRHRRRLSLRLRRGSQLRPLGDERRTDARRDPARRHSPRRHGLPGGLRGDWRHLLPGRRARRGPCARQGPVPAAAAGTTTSSSIPRSGRSFPIAPTAPVRRQAPRNPRGRRRSTTTSRRRRCGC